MDGRLRIGDADRDIADGRIGIGLDADRLVANKGVHILLRAGEGGHTVHRAADEVFARQAAFLLIIVVGGTRDECPLRFASLAVIPLYVTEALASVDHCDDIAEQRHNVGFGQVDVETQLDSGAY